MTTPRERYSYCVLRYIHDVVSGECVNVGLILLAPDQPRLFGTTRKAIGRFRQLFPDLDAAAFRVAMTAIDRGLKAVQDRLETSGLFTAETNAASCARLILPDDDSSLQWSDMGWGISDDVAATFDHLLARLVRQHDPASQRRRQDEDVWRPVRQALDERGVRVPFESRTISGKTDTISFEHAWKNGRWHVYEPMSLDLADAEGIRDKARRWRGHLSAVEDALGEAVNLCFVVGGPNDPALQDAYQNALDILKGAPCRPNVFEETNLEPLLGQIEDEFRLHEAAGRA